MAKATASKKQPVLVAVDFSPSSEQALLWAARMTECSGAPLMVLHVVHDPWLIPGYYEHAKKKKKNLTRIEEAAAEMMTEFLARMRKENGKLLGDIEHRLVAGLPITRILEVAKEIDAQQIVMGSRGRTGLPHMLLGSKAQKVAQLSPIPVTIVKEVRK
jgi:nucleotide-binding universal stress UspA family protein